MVADYPRDAESLDGGVQAVTAYLVAELARCREVALHVVTFDSSVKGLETFSKNGVSHYYLPTQRLGAMTRWAYDLKRLRHCLARINPDVVHAQGVGVDGFLSVKSGYPALVTIHGMIGEDAKFTSGWLASTRLRLQSWIAEKYCAVHARRTILISPYVQEYYGSLLQGPSHFIPNPVHERFFKVKRSEASHQLLFAGRLIPRKGVLELIEAFARAREHVDIHLTVAGSLADVQYVNRVRQRIKALGVEPYVSLCGLLKEAELLDEFAKAAVLVLPSYQETAPMVIQQAMAASIPVIATRVCGVPYQVTHGKTGLVFEPGDVAELTGCLVRLMKNHTERGAMGQEARRRALAEYSAEHVAAETVDVYKAMIDEVSSAGGVREA
ncbi:hypothetical protein BH24PSE2_BH24PSE2_12850 [soil metagenome]